MIVIIGAGKFGQTISKLLGRTPHALVDVEKNGHYSEKNKKTIKDATKAVICVPAKALEQCLKDLKPLLKIICKFA